MLAEGTSNFCFIVSNTFATPPASFASSRMPPMRMNMTRVFPEEVIVQRSHFQAIVERGAHRRVHLILGQHPIPVSRNCSSQRANEPYARETAFSIAPPGRPSPPRFPKYNSCNVAEFANVSSRSL